MTDLDGLDPEVRVGMEQELVVEMRAEDWPSSDEPQFMQSSHLPSPAAPAHLAGSKRFEQLFDTPEGVSCLSRRRLSTRFASMPSGSPNDV